MLTEHAQLFSDFDLKRSITESLYQIKKVL